MTNHVNGPRCPSLSRVKVRHLQEGKRGLAWWVLVPLVKPLLLATTKRRWIDGEKIPATGGFVMAVNHISEVDPFVIAHVVWDHGRIPRYLAKSGLFKNKLLGRVLRSAGQIPVERASKSAAGAYDAAVEAVRAGKGVVVYPEGTITRDPGLWPMVGKSGAARIALATGAPVIPVGQWGAQQILAPYGRKPRLFPRKTITIKVGDPIDFSKLGENPAPGDVAKATDQIMTAITALVADIRGEQAPTERFDPRAAGVAEYGNPHGRRS